MQRVVKAWRGQQARRIIPESATVVAPKSRLADYASRNRDVDTGSHRAAAAMGF